MRAQRAMRYGNIGRQIAVKRRDDASGVTWGAVALEQSVRPDRMSTEQRRP